MSGEELILRLGGFILPPGKRFTGDPGFGLNAHTRPVYKEIFNYMVGHDTDHVNKKKGLMFCGPVGSGKTIAIKVMQQWAIHVNGFKDRTICLISTDEYLKTYMEDPVAALELYGYNKKMELCLDELGWEAAMKNYYGNDTSVIISNLILQRHRLFIETGIRTHFTTNLFIKNDAEPIDMSVLYGPRICDRLKEMTSVINWEGGSQRI